MRTLRKRFLQVHEVKVFVIPDSIYWGTIITLSILCIVHTRLNPVLYAMDLLYPTIIVAVASFIGVMVFLLETMRLSLYSRLEAEKKVGDMVLDEQYVR